MKKLILFVLCFNFIGMAYASDNEEINRQILILQQNTQRNIALYKVRNEIVVGALFVTIGGIFQGMLPEERRKQTYAENALRASYANGEGSMSDMEFMDYQNHYRQRDENASRNIGIYEGVSWTSFGVGAICLVKGFIDLHRANKWVEHVEVTPEENLRGAKIAYRWEFGK